jgi:EmrB/QacA subfamily drug resistance transporter
MLSNKWYILLGLSLASFLGCIDLTIVNTALPAIQQDLQASVTSLQWVMNATLLALTAFMVISGKLGDLYGRRLYLYIGMAIFAVSSLGAGFSSNVEMLIGFRFLQGLGIAILYTLPIAIIPALFPKNEQGKATGLVIAANGVGLAIGPILGGFITAALSWHWIFFINVPLTLLSFAFCMNRLPETKSDDENKRIDWLGFSLLLTIFPSLILATVQGEFWGWTSWPILSLYAFSLIGFVAFVYVENKIKSPIISFKLFSNPVYIVGLFANFGLAFFYAIDFFLMPLYLHYMQGQTEMQIGLTLLPATGMIALLSSPIGSWVDKQGPKRALMLGCVLLTFSALLQIYFTQDSSIAFVISAYILFGAGFACILSPSIVAAMSSVPNHISGVAIGTIGTLHNLGGAIGLAVGTLIYQMQSESALMRAATEQHFSFGPWIQDAISETENAVVIIQSNTAISAEKAQAIFDATFLHGYSSVMVLLVATSLLTLLMVGVGLKGK